MKAVKFYAVRVGRKPGIYNTWEECKTQVSAFSKADFKSFNTLNEAKSFISLGLGRQTTGQVSTQEPRQLLLASSSLEGRQSSADTAAQEGETDIASKKRKRAEEGASSSTALTADAEAWYHMKFDGASKGNPGPAGAGAILMKGDALEEVGRVCVKLPRATNNVAEYTALIHGMEAAAAIGVRKLKVEGDSKLVVNQTNNAWKVSHEGLRPLHGIVSRLKQRFKEFKIAHIYREHNSVADDLANRAVRKAGWSGLKSAQGLIAVRSLLDENGNVKEGQQNGSTMDAFVKKDSITSRKSEGQEDTFAFTGTHESTRVDTSYLFPGQLQGEGGVPFAVRTQNHSGLSTLMNRESLPRQQSIAAPAWRQQIHSFRNRFSSCSTLCFYASHTSRRQVHAYCLSGIPVCQSRHSRQMCLQQRSPSFCSSVHRLSVMSLRCAQRPVQMLRYLQHGVSRLKCVL